MLSRVELRRVSDLSVRPARIACLRSRDLAISASNELGKTSSWRKNGLQKFCSCYSFVMASRIAPAGFAVVGPGG